MPVGLEWFEDDAERQAVEASRTIRLEGEVTEAVGGRVITQLFHLNKVDPIQPISLYIDSPGGFLAQAMAIFATMDRIVAPVHTWCRGMAGGAVVAILANGKPGRRGAVPRSRFVVSGLTIESGKPEPGEEAMEHAYDLFAQRLARVSNLSYDEVRTIFREGREWTVEQAVDAGLVDYQTPMPWD